MSTKKVSERLFLASPVFRIHPKKEEPAKIALANRKRSLRFFLVGLALIVLTFLSWRVPNEELWAILVLTLLTAVIVTLVLSWISFLGRRPNYSTLIESTEDIAQIVYRLELVEDLYILSEGALVARANRILTDIAKTALSIEVVAVQQICGMKTHDKETIEIVKLGFKSAERMRQRLANYYTKLRVNGILAEGVDYDDLARKELEQPTLTH